MVILIAAVAACGGLARFGYAHADTALLFYLDHYLDLDDKQKAIARDGLQQTFAWHRANELPLALREFSAVQDRIARGDVRPDDVDAFFRAVGASADRTIVQAAPMLATLGASLRPEQLAYLQRRFDRANADFRAEWAEGSEAQQRDKRYERALEQFEAWFGRFDRDQRTYLRERIDRLHLDYAVAVEQQTRYVERLRRQQTLLALIAQVQMQHPAAEQAAALVHGYVADFDVSPSPPRRAYEARSRAEGAALIADVIGRTTAAQRRTAVARIQRWIDDLRELAARTT